MKASSIISILIALILVIGSVGFFVVSRLQVPSYEGATPYGIELLQAISSIEDYHIYSPQILMEHMTNLLTLLYGNNVFDEMTFAHIIHMQRLLFSQELLQRNPFNEQFNNFLNHLQDHNENDIYQTHLELVSIQTTGEGYATAYLSQLFNNLGTVNWVYFLIYENGWKLHSLCPADEYFRAYC